MGKASLKACSTWVDIETRARALFTRQNGKSWAFWGAKAFSKFPQSGEVPRELQQPSLHETQPLPHLHLSPPISP